MIARSITRLLVCAVLVLSACAPTLIAPAGDDDRATELRAAQGWSSTVLLTRGGIQHDHVRLRPSDPFTFVPLHVSESDPGRLGAAIEHRLLRFVWTAGPHSGRAPPNIS